MPSMASVRSRLEAWLRTLDPDAVDLQGRDLPSIEISTGTWTFEFDAIPKSPSARGEPGIRPLGVFDTGGFRMLRTKERLRASLTEKAEQTRGVGDPLLLAMNVQGTFPDADDVFDALYGDLALSITVNPEGPGETRTTRQMTGFWTEGRLGRRAHVSGVLTVINLGPWNPHRIEPILWLNPWAQRPSELLLGLPFKQVRVDLATGVRKERDAERAAQDVLGLPDDWPAPGGPWDG